MVNSNSHVDPPSLKYVDCVFSSWLCKCNHNLAKEFLGCNSGIDIKWPFSEDPISCIELTWLKISQLISYLSIFIFIIFCLHYIFKPFLKIRQLLKNLFTTDEWLSKGPFVKCVMLTFKFFGTPPSPLETFLRHRSPYF